MTSTEPNSASQTPADPVDQFKVDDKSSPTDKDASQEPRMAAIILATAYNDGMKSSLPTALHLLAGLPLLTHSIRLAREMKAENIIVVTTPSTHQGIKNAMTALFPDIPIMFPHSEHVSNPVNELRSAISLVPSACTHVLLLPSTMPLISLDLTQKMVAASDIAPFVILEQENQAGVICQDVFYTEKAFLNNFIDLSYANVLQGQFKPHDIQLIDLITTASQNGNVATVPVPSPDELLKIQTRVDLAKAEGSLRARLVLKHQLAGVTFTDPSRVTLGVDVIIEQDVTIGVDVQILGKSHIHHSNKIEGPTMILNTTIEPHSHIRQFSHLEEAHISSNCIVGPYARSRPGTHLCQKAMVRNFVEMTNTNLGAGSKINHLAFVAAANIGSGSNIGAGVITWNYDSVNKHSTRIAEGVFVGSNSTLVAPVEVGNGAFVAAGSVITADVGDDVLAFGRARQVLKEGGAMKLVEKSRSAKVAKEKIV